MSEGPDDYDEKVCCCPACNLSRFMQGMGADGYNVNDVIAVLAMGIEAMFKNVPPEHRDQVMFTIIDQIQGKTSGMALTEEGLKDYLANLQQDEDDATH